MMKLRGFGAMAACLSLAIGSSAMAQQGGVAPAAPLPAPLLAPAMNYDCDAAAGHSSSIVLSAPGPAFVVQGSVTPYRAYPSKVAATATIALSDSAGGDTIALRLSTADGEAKSFASVIEVLQSGAPSSGPGPGVAVNRPLAFAIAMSRPGAIEMMVGDQKFTSAMEIKGRVVITIGCTTGGFRFEQLGWGVLP